MKAPHNLHSDASSLAASLSGHDTSLPKNRRRHTKWIALYRQKAKRLVRRFAFWINAVSYRKPRSVIKVIQYSDGNCFPVCPRCSISMDKEYMSYCDRCGQRLRWKHFDRAEVCHPPINHGDCVQSAQIAKG